MRTTSQIWILLFAGLITAVGLSQSSNHNKKILGYDKNPWPEIRKQRIQQLLPSAMQRSEVDAWVVICRENNNDPLAEHVGGENAGGTAAFVFLKDGSGIRSIVLSPSGEATALKDIGLHDEIIILDRRSDVWQQTARILRESNPGSIAINSSALAVADGLTYTQRNQLEAALGPNLSARLVTSEELVVQWLSVKLPEEVEILRRAAALTEK